MELNATTVTVLMNVIGDIYFRAREIQPDITPENIKDYIEELEQKAITNNQEFGIAD